MEPNALDQLVRREPIRTEDSTVWVEEWLMEGRTPVLTIERDGTRISIGPEEATSLGRILSTFADVHS